MAREITNSDDVIDSREVIERIEELTAERDALVDALGEANADKGKRKAAAARRVKAKAALAAWDESEEGKELTALTKLANEAEGYAADWKYGETLIRDSYFKEYAEQLAEDIGAINQDATWPNNCIDWERAAHELQMDYTSVDFDGVEYLIR